MKNKNSKARQYKPSTIRRLDILSGNQCSNPYCTKKLIAEDNTSIISKICHIEAASEDGPRYNQRMTDDQRRGFDNLLLLCDEHHTIIDNKENEEIYSTFLLKTWKNDHEQKILEIITSKNLLSKYPLALNRVINFIGNNINEVLDLTETAVAQNADSKILFNNVIRYEPVIKEFAPYQGKLNKIYEEIEKAGSPKKELVLYSIKSIYLEFKKDYPTIEDVKENADIIIDKVIESILEKIDAAPNKLIEFDQETINFSLMIVIVDAFMRCNILEAPNK